MNNNETVIEIKDLVRRFVTGKGRQRKELTALDGVNLKVPKGELFGLLGPNGAGKTTLIKILSTLLLPTSGEVYIHGMDVTKEIGKIRRIINMVGGGDNTGYGILTVRENLWMFSQFYNLDNKTANKRIDELLSVVKLLDKENEKVNRLSTGMSQKLNFARGFINDPLVVYLDEPTLGLDVNAARDVRNYVKRWMKEKQGKSVILTTHYMMEAHELCDRVAIINDGKILACDSPDNLIRMVSSESIFELSALTEVSDWDELNKIDGVSCFTSKGNDSGELTNFKFILKHDGPVDTILSAILQKGAKIETLKKTEPTLEDVFIKLVGESMEEAEKSSNEAAGHSH